jgi:hypothetical protein
MLDYFRTDMTVVAVRVLCGAPFDIIDLTVNRCRPRPVSPNHLRAKHTQHMPWSMWQAELPPLVGAQRCHDASGCSASASTENDGRKSRPPVRDYTPVPGLHMLAWDDRTIRLVRRLAQKTMTRSPNRVNMCNHGAGVERKGTQHRPAFLSHNRVTRVTNGRFRRHSTAASS